VDGQADSSDKSRVAQRLGRTPDTRAVRVAMLVAGALALVFLFLLALSPVVREETARGLHPIANAALPLAFLLVPYLTAFLLLARTDRRGLVASGAGISSVLFVALILVSRWSLLLVFTWAGLSGNAYLIAALAVLILFFADAVWVLWCSLRHAANSWASFLAAAAVTVGYLWFGFPVIQLWAYRSAQRQQQARAAQTMTYLQARDAARSALESLTACLIEYRASQPAGEFPSSLSNLPRSLTLPSGQPCDSALADPGAVPQYRFIYSPEKDAASGKLIGFRLLAMPVGKGMDYVNPMLSDARGRIFVYERWFATEQGEHLVPLLTEQPSDLDNSRLLQLRAELQFSMKNKGLERPPPSLAAWHTNSDAEATDAPDSLKEGPYLVKYLPPRLEDPTRFALSARCQSYGEKCIRSFFLGYDGGVHQTVEPRSATAEDPLIPDCEKYGQTCRDVDWAVP